MSLAVVVLLALAQTPAPLDESHDADVVSVDAERVIGTVMAGVGVAAGSCVGFSASALVFFPSMIVCVPAAAGGGAFVGGFVAEVVDHGGVSVEGFVHAGYIVAGFVVGSVVVGVPAALAFYGSIDDVSPFVGAAFGGVGGVAVGGPLGAGAVAAALAWSDLETPPRLESVW